MSFAHLDFLDCPEAKQALSYSAFEDTAGAGVLLRWYAEYGRELMDTSKTVLEQQDELLSSVLEYAKALAQRRISQFVDDIGSLPFRPLPERIRSIPKVTDIEGVLARMREGDASTSNLAFMLRHHAVTGAALNGTVYDIHGFKDVLFSPIFLGVLEMHHHLTRGDHLLERLLHIFRDVWLETELRRLSSTPNILVPADPLAYRLLATDTQGVHGRDVTSPFPAFILVLPPKLFGTTYRTSGRHYATHVKVGIEDNPAQWNMEVMPELRALHWRIEHGKGSHSKQDFDYPYSQATAFLTRDAVHLEVHGNITTWDEVSFFIGDQATNFAGIHTAMCNYLVNTLLYLGRAKERGELRLQNAEELRKAKDKAMKKHPRKVDVERYRRLKDTSSIFEYGTHVVIDHDIERMVRTGNKPRGTKWEMSYKTVVRGHWRSQAHGPGRTLRRPQWIQPHTRGPDFSEKIAGHVYVVKG